MSLSSTSRPSIVSIETSSPSPSLSPVSNQSDEIDETLSRNAEISGEKTDTEPECGEDCKFSSDDAVIFSPTTDDTNIVTSPESRVSTLESRVTTTARVTLGDTAENTRVTSSDVITRVTTITSNNDSLVSISESSTEMESSSQRVTTEKSREEDSNITKIIYLFDEKTEQTELQLGGNIITNVVTQSPIDTTTPVSKITFIFNGTQSQEVSPNDDSSVTPMGELNPRATTRAPFTSQPGTVQINLTKPSPRYNESEFEPIRPQDQIGEGDSGIAQDDDAPDYLDIIKMPDVSINDGSGVTITTQEGVMITNPNVAIQINFPDTDKNSPDDNESVSVKYSFGELQEEENEIDDTPASTADQVMDSNSKSTSSPTDELSRVSTLVTTATTSTTTFPQTSTTTRFSPPPIDSLPMFDKDIFAVTEPRIEDNMILLDVMADSDQNVQNVVDSPNVDQDQASVTSEGGEGALAERNEETVSEVTVTEKMLDRATENNDDSNIRDDDGSLLTLPRGEPDEGERISEKSPIQTVVTTDASSSASVSSGDVVASSTTTKVISVSQYAANTEKIIFPSSTLSPIFSQILDVSSESTKVKIDANEPKSNTETLLNDVNQENDPGNKESNGKDSGTSVTEAATISSSAKSSYPSSPSSESSSGTVAGINLSSKSSTESSTQSITRLTSSLVTTPTSSDILDTGSSVLVTNSNLETTSETIRQQSQPDEVTQKAANDDSEPMSDIPVSAIDPPALSRSNPDAETNDLIRDSTTASKSGPVDESTPSSFESSSAVKKEGDSGQSSTISSVTDPTDVATMPLNTGDEYSEMEPDKNNASQAEEVKSVTKETDISVTEEPSSVLTVGEDKADSNSRTPSSDQVKVSEVLDNNVESPTPTPSPVSNQQRDEMSGKVTTTLGKRPASSNNSMDGLKSQDASLQLTTGSSLMMVDEGADTKMTETVFQLGRAPAPSSESVNDIVMTPSSVGEMNDRDGSPEEEPAAETSPRLDGQIIKPVTSQILDQDTVSPKEPNIVGTSSSSSDSREATLVTKETKTSTATTLMTQATQEPNIVGISYSSSESKEATLVTIETTTSTATTLKTTTTTSLSSSSKTQTSMIQSKTPMISNTVTTTTPIASSTLSATLLSTAESTAATTSASVSPSTSALTSASTLAAESTAAATSASTSESTSASTATLTTTKTTNVNSPPTDSNKKEGSLTETDSDASV